MNGFAWQDGDGAFSVGKSQIADTVRYIQDQRKHHLCATFEDEYHKLLKMHEIVSEERYILG